MSSEEPPISTLGHHPIQSNPIQSNPIYLDIRCGTSPIAVWLTAHLAAFGVYHHAVANIAIVCDWPTGFALDALSDSEQSIGHMIVVTGATCSEYLADLWDQRPAALLAADTLDCDLPIALNSIARGERYCAVDCATPLTPAERRALRYLAYMWDDKRIAACLCVNRQSVSNTVSRMLHKLRLANRATAALY
jgi:DNA-binding CsgD family transcriptional regulator